jgi:Family of unknown function (DUF6364)
MAKITLNVDDQVLAQAKQYAKLQGVSLSEMVEAYLADVPAPANPTAGTAPVLRSARSALKNVDIGDYRKHLTLKYR